MHRFCPSLCRTSQVIITCSLRRFLSVTFIYPTQPLILPRQRFSIACPFFLHCTFTLHCSCIVMAKMYCIIKENLTFLGFCKITPSTSSLMNSLYRQTGGYSNTTKATLTWTVNRQNYASNLHIKQLLSPRTPEFPHIDCLQSSNTGGICKNA